MSKRRSTRLQSRGAQQPVATQDSFQNFAARTGVGTDNMSTVSSYGFNPISRNRVQIEFMYRGSWLVGKAVDIPAEDMTRAGIDISGTVPPDEIENLHQNMHKLAIWQAINDTIKWSRLYGGAIAVMLIDGQNLETPLRPESVSQDQFKGLFVLDRWQVTPSLTDTVDDFGPDIGLPKFYRVNQNASALRNKNIHYSRVIRFDGFELPYQQRITENLWGLSVIERLFDRLTAFDSATAGAAQLVFKAHLRTYKVKDLRKVIAAGGPAYDALIKQIDLIRKFQSNEGLTLMDAEDEFEAHQYTFAGLSDITMQFGQQLSGAVDIPLVRLFGQSPAGMNATGESDLRNYYDSISAQQERRMRRALTTLLTVMFQSLFGKAPPDNFGFKFNPLWQMSENEKATAANTVAQAVSGVYGDGIISRATALKELRQSADVTGIFSNISDEEIEEAEGDEPPGAEGAIEPADQPDNDVTEEENEAEAIADPTSGGGEK